MKTLLLFLTGIFSLVSFAQDGSLDTSFGDNGVVITDLNNSWDMGYSVAEQADQKLIVSGTMKNLNSNLYFPYLVRYMPNGIIDNSFGTDGRVIGDFGLGANGYKYLFVDNQQNIVSAGNMYYYSNFVIAKYLENGDLDIGFGDNGILTITNGDNSVMTLLEDGSLLLLDFSGANEITLNHYLSNGVLDTNFGINGTATSTFFGDGFESKEIRVDGENNIFFLGTRDNSYDSDIILMKFEPNGYLDTTFGNNGMATKNINTGNPSNVSSASLDFTNNNKIVIAGSTGTCYDISQPVFWSFIIKFQNDGVLDPSFGNDGTILLPFNAFKISQILIQANQRMLLIGIVPDCFESYDYIITRYFEGGQIDNSFNSASIEFSYNKTILQQDGKIVSVGNKYFSNDGMNIVLVRHNNNVLSTLEFEKNQITVYPNPSNGIFTIEREFSETSDYQITDITGKNIASGELGDKQTQIDLSSAQSGVYFLKTSNGVFRLLKN